MGFPSQPLLIPTLTKVHTSLTQGHLQALVPQLPANLPEGWTLFWGAERGEVGHYSACLPPFQPFT